MSKPKERPIIMQAHSVRAILEGRKTQTRRVVTPQPMTGNYRGLINCEWLDCNVEPDRNRYGFWSTGETAWPCPYGGPGDVLWAKETWASDDRGRVAYKASEETWPTHTKVKDGSGWVSWKWRSSMFMPRVNCRLTLKVNSVRVELLQDIDADDAKAEGFPYHVAEHTFEKCYRFAEERAAERLDCFRTSWDAINGKRPGCTWADNPWVWVVSFAPSSPPRAAERKAVGT